tara:strand:+ start:50 stop:418 length:369 start_codon:yes stop_codon:yes gene_type:complete
MSTIQIKLTEKEASLLATIAMGMDSYGCGWLHEIGEGTHSEAGVLGSLIQKDLVESREDTEGGAGTCYYVSLLSKGAEIAGLEDDDCYSWDLSDCLLAAMEKREDQHDFHGAILEHIKSVAS